MKLLTLLKNSGQIDIVRRFVTFQNRTTSQFVLECRGGIYESVGAKVGQDVDEDIVLSIGGFEGGYLRGVGGGVAGGDEWWLKVHGGGWFWDDDKRFGMVRWVCLCLSASKSIW